MPRRVSSNSGIRASPSIARHPPSSHHTTSLSVHQNLIAHLSSSASSTTSQSSTRDASSYSPPTFPPPFFPSPLEIPLSISKPGSFHSPSWVPSPALSTFEPVASPSLGPLSPCGAASDQGVLQDDVPSTHPTLDVQDSLHSGHRQLSPLLADWRAATEVEMTTEFPPEIYPPTLAIAPAFTVAQAVSSPTIQYGFGDESPQPAYFDYQKHQSVINTAQYRQQPPNYCYSVPTPALDAVSVFNPPVTSTPPSVPPYVSSDPYASNLSNLFSERPSGGSQTLQQSLISPSVWSSEHPGGARHSSVDVHSTHGSWGIPTRPPTPSPPLGPSMLYHPKSYDQPQQHLQMSYSVHSYESMDIAAPQPTKAEWSSWFLPPNPTQ